MKSLNRVLTVTSQTQIYNQIPGVETADKQVTKGIVTLMENVAVMLVTQVCVFS